MTNTNDEHAALRKLRARHAGLDLDIKLLRLRLKAGFNPAQPRVPAGDRDGGQWTDSGGGAGRSLERFRLWLNRVGLNEAADAAFGAKVCG